MDLSGDIIFRSLVCPTQQEHPTGRDSRIARVCERACGGRGEGDGLFP